MKINLLFAITFIIMLFSCQSKECTFPDNFVEKDSIGNEVLYTKEINENDMNLLMATNEVNEPIFNIDHKYYYGYKEKLDEDHYLVSFKNIYRPSYRFTRILHNWADIYLCIYNRTENKIVSKLKIISSDPVLSSYKEENHNYIITSYYTMFECSDLDCNSIKMNPNNVVVSNYKIIGNKFQKIKDN